ncbi:MAG: patatin, partial [Tannerellaceae bacterium]|nr:patatin [Tannerellaceae bacterium]
NALLHQHQRPPPPQPASEISTHPPHDDHINHPIKGTTCLARVSVGYAYNSLAGPLNTTLGISNRNKSLTFYLNLGYRF